ncbi:MAG: flagellar biosynthesis protein FlgL [Agathobacter sp.]|nr:flagellar biosynthesis protein FlgL [Agathobacter sp.]
MRITNTMITNNTKSNINSNKLLVDKYNTQMTTQKKISKASENPVIAIRSLRLSTTLSHINQYVDNNIPDASAWMDVTETALTNMKDLLTDIRTHCVNGSTDTLNQEDRQTILDGLKALSDQVYAEGNADYAGKTVFTGYRTSSNLTFDEEELDTRYEINQSFDYSNLEEKRYYTGDVVVPEAVITGSADPANDTKDCTTTIAENTYERIRLAYNGDTQLNDFSYTYTDANGTQQTVAFARDVQVDPATGETTVTYPEINGVASPVMKVYETEQDWEADKQAAGLAGKVVDNDEIIYIEQTGEFIFGKNVANTLSDGRAQIDVNYEKQGFAKGELRPEYYYDCTDMSDDDDTKWVTYTKENQEIHYTVANNADITINTQADSVFDSSIARDVDELINVVQKAIDANNKIAKIEEMMAEAQYQDEASQEKLKGYLEAAKKEADFADDNLQKTYEAYIGRFDKYLEKTNIAITNVGSVKNSLNLTRTRVENQQMTLEELKSDNEDRDISDIIIDYYASYNAYQSSLTAAGKLGQSSLLDYI